MQTHTHTKTNIQTTHTHIYRPKNIALHTYTPIHIYRSTYISKHHIYIYKHIHTLYIYILQLNINYGFSLIDFLHIEIFCFFFSELGNTGRFSQNTMA